MGAASIMVVLLHFVVELYPEFHVPGITSVLSRGNIGVDIFLLVSGMGLWFSMSKNSDVKQFWRKRVQRVYLPSLVLTLPYWLWYDLCFQKAGILRLFMDWSGVSFWTHGITTTWYVSMIMLCYLFYPLIFRMQQKNRNLVIGLAAVLIAVFCLFAVIQPQAYDRCEIALTRIPVFLIGSYLGEYILNKDASPKSSKLVLNCYTLAAIAVFVLSAAVNGRNHEVGIMLYRYGCGGVGILISLAVCWVLEKWTMKPVSRFLKYLGAVSLELYLIHVMIRNIVHNTSLGGLTAAWQQIIVIISFILISLAVTWAVCSLKERISHKGSKKNAA